MGNRYLKIAALLVALAVSIDVLAQGPLTNLANLRGRTDANGYLMTSLAAYTAPTGPLTNLANIRVRTDANGYLMTTSITELGSVTVDGATTFAVTSTYMTLACTGAESINTITGGASGMVLYLDHSDTDCTIVDDDAATATDAVDLTGSGNDAGAAKKILVLIYNGDSWQEVSESDN